MPSTPNQLPDDGMDDRNNTMAGDNSIQDEEFNPTGLESEHLGFLAHHATQDEREKIAQQVSEFVRSLPKDGLTAEAGQSFYQMQTFFRDLLSRVTARVEAASTAVPPTVTPTEQGEEQEERRGEEDEGDEGHAAPTERSMSDTETIPPRSENPTQQ